MGTSNDAYGELPEEARSYRIAQAIVAEATGEPVELILKRAWPTLDFPEVVDRWMGRYEPDLAYLSVPAYSFLFESVPLKLRRKFGRIGEKLGQAGQRASKEPWLAGTPFFKFGRRLAQLTIGGATHFEPEQVIESMTGAIRVVVRNEGTTLVVSGPRNAYDYHASRGRRRRAEERRLRVHRALKDLCQEAHVDYFGSETAAHRFESPSTLFDGVHADAQQQRANGERAAQRMLEALARVRVTA
jgi:hypothetical protein